MPYKDKEKDKECKRIWQQNNAKKHRKATADYDKRNQEKVRARTRKWMEKNPVKILLGHARRRAKEKGLEFSITEKDIIIPQTCPLLGQPMVKNTKYAPSIDRIDSSRGYVPDNVWVISRRANGLKSNASVEELQLLVNALASLLGSSSGK